MLAQGQEGDLWGAAEAEGDGVDSDSCGDVEECIFFSKEASGVESAMAGGDDEGAEEWESPLTAVGVAGEDEIASGAGDFFDVVGAVA